MGIAIFWFFAVALFLNIYFLPGLVALWRQHHNSLAIIICNLFFGWTLLGWAFTLVWACTVVKRAPSATALH